MKAKSTPRLEDARGPRILIVEDHPILRRGLKDILIDEYPAATFGEAADARAALQALARAEWDVLLLDIVIPGRDGLELLADARRIRPAMRVLVVSAFPEEEFAIRAYKLGAAGYLGKNQAPEALVTAVQTVLAGTIYVNPGMAPGLAAALCDNRRGQSPHEALSARELQVLRLIAAGRTIKAIAAELALSEKTIATYRARIAAKAHLSTNVQLARYAFRHGLVQ